MQLARMGGQLKDRGKSHSSGSFTPHKPQGEAAPFGFLHPRKAKERLFLSSSPSTCHAKGNDASSIGFHMQGEPAVCSILWSLKIKRHFREEAAPWSKSASVITFCFIKPSLKLQTGGQILSHSHLQTGLGLFRNQTIIFLKMFIHIYMCVFLYVKTYTLIYQYRQKKSANLYSKGSCFCPGEHSAYTR